VDNDMFREIAHRLPALLDAGRYSAAGSDGKGRKGEA
jgi:hypothetical protein